MKNGNLALAIEDWVATECERLGGPPTPDEMTAYANGELSESEAARVRALLVYYPELTPLLQKPRRVPWKPIVGALVIAAFAALLIPRERPYVHATSHELRPLRTRGATPPAYVLPANEERYLMTLLLVEAPPSVSVQIVDVANGKVLWRARDVQPADDTLSLSVPRSLLRGRKCRIDVHHGEQLFESYRVVSP